MPIPLLPPRPNLTPARTGVCEPLWTASTEEFEKANLARGIPIAWVGGEKMSKQELILGRHMYDTSVSKTQQDSIWGISSAWKEQQTEYLTYLGAAIFLSLPALYSDKRNVMKISTILDQFSLADCTVSPTFEPDGEPTCDTSGSPTYAPVHLPISPQRDKLIVRPTKIDARRRGLVIQASIDFSTTIAAIFPRERKPWYKMSDARVARAPSLLADIPIQQDRLRTLRASLLSTKAKLDNGFAELNRRPIFNIAKDGGVLDKIGILVDDFELKQTEYSQLKAAVAAAVFGRLATEWKGYDAPPSEYLEAGDNVVVALGRSVGVNTATGKAIDAQFAHVWRLRDGRIMGFQQYTDTLQFWRATQSD